MSDSEIELHTVVRPSWMTGTPECDWSEDSSHENGNYFNKCASCSYDFIGHKLRHVCRKCHYEAKAIYDAMTSEEQAEWDAKRVAEIRDYFKTNAESSHARNER